MRSMRLQDLVSIIMQNSKQYLQKKQNKLKINSLGHPKIEIKGQYLR